MLLLLGTLASTSTTRSYQLACLSVRLLCHSAAIVVEGYSIKVVTSISYNGIISLRTICLMNLNKLRFYHLLESPSVNLPLLLVCSIFILSINSAVQFTFMS